MSVSSATAGRSQNFDVAPPSPSRISGLDGLRALAVVAVVAYHLDAPWTPGGFLGVDLFMVLSGYLITRLLLQESERTGRIDVPGFWIRRAKRLLPAAVTLVMVVTAIAAILFADDQLSKIRAEALSAVFYVANWRFIAAKAGYFDLFSEASPFRHLWSLAIEEQFYVMWPVVVLVVRRRVSMLLPITVGLTIASAVEMALLVHPVDPSRVYYGTDTRAQTLFVGCTLAMVLNGRQWRPGTQIRAAWLALVSAIAMMVAFVSVHDSEIFMYRGGFVGFALLAALAIGSTVVAGGRGFVAALEHPAIVAIGKGSYSIYLWHWPVIVFVSPARLGVGTTPANLIRVGVTALAAYASYRWIESPVRHRRLSARTVGFGVLLAASLTTAAVFAVTLGERAPAKYFSANGDVIAASPRASATATTTPVPTVLLLGDSVAASLSDAMINASATSPFVLVAAPVSGCGLLPGVTLDTTTQIAYEPSRGCPAKVDAAIELAIEKVRPAVVVWMSVWDAENRELDDGSRVALETVEGRDSLYGLIDDRVDGFASHGIRTVLVTDAPVGRSGSLAEPPAIKQQRILAYDDVLRRYAEDHPAVGLVDLAGKICPDDTPCDDIALDGQPFRPSDGIHYQGEPAVEVATWLIADLAGKVAG